MSLDTLKDRIPDYAKDLRLNLGSISTISSLTQQQLWGTVLSSALATGNGELIRHADETASQHLTPEARNAAKSANAIMGMNNIYYRFTHLVANEQYLNMPARLRMNVIGNPGVEKVDFELWSLAVSAVEGCGRCIEAHEQTLVQHGTSREAIQDAVRIAAILKGVAVTLATEAALSGDDEMTELTASAA
jgi:alkyl hydroperoxide reductase subunit D